MERTEIDDADKFISWSGPLPEKLYRYRSLTAAKLDRLIDFEILEEGVFLSALKDLNDPDEGRFNMRFIGTEEEISGFWRSALRSSLPDLSADQINAEAALRTSQVVLEGFDPPMSVVNYQRYVFENVLRVVCFTTDPVNFSMWANYARYHDGEDVTDHGGVCLEYNCTEAWRRTTLHPVSYSNEIPLVNVVSRDGHALARTVYCKSREWRAEEEWRIAYILNILPPFPDNLSENAKLYFPGSLASIIFGLRAPSALVEEVSRRVSAKAPYITLKRIERDPRTHARRVILL